jgi:hypothetical protein
MLRVGRETGGARKNEEAADCPAAGLFFQQRKKITKIW